MDRFLYESLVEAKKKQRKKAVAKKRRSRSKINTTYTTGDPDYNIAQFNKRFGGFKGYLTGHWHDNDTEELDLVLVDATPDGSDLGGEGGDFGGDFGGGEGGGMGESLSLHETKREVRRYYIRPQNIFCANKKDVLKSLIDIDNQNCTVYTLNNLGDEKDVTKLTNKDIIYYYDNGILYDKNKVKIMDYDLYIRHEEERPLYTAPVDKVPETTFKQDYEDRATEHTIGED